MTDKEIFKELFKIAESTESRKGIVAACLVRDGEIIAISTGSDNPNRHAEDLLLEKIRNQNIPIQEDDVLYVTLQPCGERTPGGGGEKYGDCTTNIIKSPIKHVVYGAADHHYSLEVNDRFKKAGISSRQIDDPEIAQKATKIFNETITDEEYIGQKGKKAFL